MKYQPTLRFAREMDRKDPLKGFRKQFIFPKHKGKDALYFVGNSLGLQPKSARREVDEVFAKWASHGVEGFFSGKNPWMHYHQLTRDTLAQLTGARPSEVVAMNQLTVNIHLMMATFYRPSGTRTRILVESGCFPSDRYAIASQIRWHGLNPAMEMVEVKPPEGEFLLRNEDLVKAIQMEGDRLALVLLGGVQYYTGQFFNISEVAAAAHSVGAIAGVDLAHAIGNVPLNLHDDDVDFAVWCGYKYLNSGPGGLAGIFVHDRHGVDRSLPRLAGWWGRDPDARFRIREDFVPMEGAAGWQVSTFTIVPGAIQRASLELFRKAGFKALRRKSVLLTGYLDFLIRSLPGYGKVFEIITPSNPDERGCQLSLFLPQSGKRIFQILTRNGVMADWREPGVIRISPVPMYTSFENVYRFYEIFSKALRTLKVH